MPSTDTAVFARPRYLPGIELVDVIYENRKFPQHSHPEYLIGAITSGSEMLKIGQENYKAETNSVIQLYPGQVHANASIGSQPLRYKVMYLSRSIFSSGPESKFDCTPPVFTQPVLSNTDLCDIIINTHSVLCDPVSDELEQDSAFMTLMNFYRKEPIFETKEKTLAQHVVEKMQSYIDRHYNEAFGLHQIADHTGYSVFHCSRLFKDIIGLSPIAYRNQQRVMAARLALLKGHPIAEVAIDVGFADQSHLTRQFQSIMGTSPAQYARNN